MDDIEIEITDNHGLVGDALKKAVERGLEAIGLTAEDHAKRICPVDTGRLKDRLTNAGYDWAKVQARVDM